MLNLVKKPTTRLQILAKRIRDNRDGVAAIEFVFIAPVMIVLYIGIAEVSLLISADRGVSHAASVTGDLVTQKTTLTKRDMEDIFNAALTVFGENYTNSRRVSIDVISFKVDGAGTTQEVGYARLGTGFSTKYDSTGTSATLLNQTSGLVVTRVKYEYSSPSRTYVQTPDLKETFMLKPRKSNIVLFDGAASIQCRVTNVSGMPRARC